MAETQDAGSDGFALLFGYEEPVQSEPESPHTVVVYPLDLLPFDSEAETYYDDHDVYLEVEHPEDCPGRDPEKDCPIDFEFQQVGIWEALMGWEAHRPRFFETGPVRYLAPGAYLVTPWYEHYPAGPWGADEWDSGLEAVPVAASRPSPEGSRHAG